ncbi:MAG: ribosomal-processing cysteine protease Prp [Candidatus Saccharibacteria bacterium]
MVRVEILKDQDDNILAFRVEGHADYEDEGQDIVCAGISAITQTALVGLLNYMENKPVYKRKNGILACSMKPKTGPEDMAKAQIILGTMEMGLRDIEHHYKEFIDLDIRRC